MTIDEIYKNENISARSYNVCKYNVEKTVKLTTHFQCKLTTSFGAN
jgi:hypothetical protein